MKYLPIRRANSWINKWTQRVQVWKWPWTLWMCLVPNPAFGPDSFTAPKLCDPSVTNYSYIQINTHESGDILCLSPFNFLKLVSFWMEIIHCLSYSVFSISSYACECIYIIFGVFKGLVSGRRYDPVAGRTEAGLPGFARWPETQ